MTTPRHPGSRLVSHPPNLIRDIRKIIADIQAARDRTRPETLTFVPSVPSRGEPCTSATMVNVLETYVYRSGNTLYADVACGTGTGSVMSVQFSVPALSLTGAAATTPSGGTEQIVRISLTLPDAWASGAAYLTYVQGQRVSGSDSTTVRVLRAWQR
jgi:hypothetical protein